MHNLITTLAQTAENAADTESDATYGFVMIGLFLFLVLTFWLMLVSLRKQSKAVDQVDKAHQHIEVAEAHMQRSEALQQQTVQLLQQINEKLDRT